MSKLDQVDPPVGQNDTPGSRWFSSNQDKAWTEKFFLLYTPYWMVCMGALMASGAGGRWGDTALNLAMAAIIAPLVVVPVLAGRARAAGRPWYRCYWAKATLWLAIFSSVGSYFGSEYFFDVLGMYYNYPQLAWTADSALLGSGEQSVPLIMYPSALFYFASYHTAAVVLMRRASLVPVLSSRLATPLVVLLVAYVFAWAETFLMAGGSIDEQFGYHDLGRMLRWGSLFYSCYFVVSFPMFKRLDETDGQDWSPGRVALEALATSMVVVFLLDLATHAVGRIY